MQKKVEIFCSYIMNINCVTPVLTESHYQISIRTMSKHKRIVKYKITILEHIKYD